MGKPRIPKSESGVEAERWLRGAHADTSSSEREPPRINPIKCIENLQNILPEFATPPKFVRDAPDITDRMVIPVRRLPDWKRDIWRGHLRTRESDRRDYPTRKLLEPLPSPVSSINPLNKKYLNQFYNTLPLLAELRPDVQSTMRGSRLPSAREVFTGLLADPTYISREAQAAVAAYERGRRDDDFYRISLGPRTLRQAVAQRSDTAARDVALGINSGAYDYVLRQLVDSGARLTARDTSVTMRTSIDRTDLCFDQLYRTLTADTLRDRYVAAVMPKAEAMLKRQF